MSIKNEILVDRVKKIYHADGMIKCELIQLKPILNEKNTISEEMINLVMSPECFIKTCDIVKLLLEIGFFKIEKHKKYKSLPEKIKGINL